MKASNPILMGSLRAQFEQLASSTAMMPFNIHIEDRLSAAQLRVLVVKSQADTSS